MSRWKDKALLISLGMRCVNACWFKWCEFIFTNLLLASGIGDCEYLHSFYIQFPKRICPDRVATQTISKWIYPSFHIPVTPRCNYCSFQSDLRGTCRVIKRFDFIQANLREINANSCEFWSTIIAFWISVNSNIYRISAVLLQSVNNFWHEYSMLDYFSEET